MWRRLSQLQAVLCPCSVKSEDTDDYFENCDDDAKFASKASRLCYACGEEHNGKTNGTKVMLIEVFCRIAIVLYRLIFSVQADLAVE